MAQGGTAGDATSAGVRVAPPGAPRSARARARADEQRGAYPERDGHDARRAHFSRRCSRRFDAAETTAARVSAEASGTVAEPGLEVLRGSVRHRAEPRLVVRPAVLRARRQRRARDPGQARADPPGPRLPHGGGPPPHRGRPRRGQDVAGQGDGALDRRRLPPDPVHARPPTVRRNRRLGVEPCERRLRVPSRQRVRQRRARRRDQPRVAEDTVGAARGDGGTTGHGRRAHVPAAPAVHGDRDPEPDRARRHVSAPRGATRPVPHAHPNGLPRPRRRTRHPRGPRRAARAARTTCDRSPTRTTSRTRRRSCRACT